MEPYIGITDFMNFGQVERMLKVFNEHKPQGSNRKLHVGVMMSYKTLKGIPNKWQNVFPPKETIANIFSSDDTYNCLHYADYDKNLDLWKSLAHAIFYGGVGINALQLDMVWPDPTQIASAVHSSRKQIEVILQIGRNAMEDAGNNPKVVANRLGEYDGIIHRVLLDKSMGRGLGMDAQELIPFAQEIKTRFPELGIVAAGGLGPETMHLVQPLVEKFSDISIDAQSRLRPSGNALDPVDWSMAEEYLVNALKLFP